MRPTSLLLLALALVTGCADGRFRSYEIEPGGDDPTSDPTRPSTPMADPNDWTVRVDSDASDRYLERRTATANVRGTVEASLGPDRAEVDGDDVALDARGGFSATAPVPEGLSLVEIHGWDVQDHEARGDRAILRADYLPEGEMDSDALSIAVDDALLSGLVSGALGSGAGGLGSLSLSSFITPGSAIVSGSPCTIYVDSVEHSPPRISLAVGPDGRLVATFTVPDIAVGIHGECTVGGGVVGGLLGIGPRRIGIQRGSQMNETDVAVTVTLEANFPGPGECLSGLTASDPQVSFTRFDLDLRLSGGLLLSAAGELVGELAEGFVKGMLEDKVQEMIGPALGPALEGVSLLETTNTMNFLSTPVDMSLCLTGLDGSTGTLVATLGVSAMGPGGMTDAPGAPRLPASAGTLAPSTLAIDPALIGQILFSAWRGGALQLDSLGGGSGSGPALTVDLLSGVVPALRPLLGDAIPRGAPLDISIDAAMAPLARGPSPMEAAAGADFMMELGDLRITIGAGGSDLFVLSSTLRLGLALEPNADGALVPTLVAEATSSSTHLADTTVPGVTGRMGESLANLVNGMVPTQLGPLLEGAAISLPDVGAPLRVTGVVADADGTMHITIVTGP
jgi:hypothetical protein